MEHDFFELENGLFDQAITLIKRQNKIIEEQLENGIRYYVEQNFGLNFNKKEMIKMLSLYNNRLTANDIQYLIYAVQIAESDWGVKTDLQEKLLRLMEITEND